MTSLELKLHPVKYIPPLVKACLSGRKTQTRRLVSLPEPLSKFPQWLEPGTIRGDTVCFTSGNAPFHVPDIDFVAACPCGAPGDVMTLSEPWLRHTDAATGQDGFLYQTDFIDTPLGSNATADGMKRLWMDAVTLPKDGVRQFQFIESLRVERLQCISDADCIAEGIQQANDTEDGAWYVDIQSGRAIHRSARDAYAALMDSLYGNGFWDHNPWVWVISFKPLESLEHV
jgi:hypothetical protein